MFRRKSIAGMVLAGILVLSLGLGSLIWADASDKDNRNTHLADREWVLLSLGGNNSSQNVLDGTEITIAFVTGHANSAVEFSGSAGCNHYFGSFETTTDELIVGPIGATEMWCGDAEVMDQESQFLTALGTVDGYQVSGNMLEMPYDGGVLIFTER